MEGTENLTGMAAVTMGGTTLTAEEAAEFVEFRRTRRETEISVTLSRLILDASRRETDVAALRKACDTAKKLRANGVLVSPVNTAVARKRLMGSGVRLFCTVGGTGETLPAVKKCETKRALRAGCTGIRLIPCYSALFGKNFAYVKREIRRIVRAAGRCPVILSLEDHALGEEEVALAVRAASEAGAGGVCVRGETQFLLRALSSASSRIRVDCAGVENAEQLRLLLRAGASCLVTSCAEKVADELYAADTVL